VPLQKMLQNCLFFNTATNRVILIKADLGKWLEFKHQRRVETREKAAEQLYRIVSHGLLLGIPTVFQNINLIGANSISFLFENVEYSCRNRYG